MTTQRHNPKDVLHRFYDAEREYTNSSESERSFEIVAAMFADDYYMEQTSALPWAGVYRGPKGMEEWIRKASEWVVIDVQNPQIFENKESDRVVVLSKVVFTCRKTGQVVDFPLSQTVVVDTEKGVIKEIRSYYWDVKTLNRAMGYEG